MIRKYLEVSKIYMKAQLTWRADVIFNVVFTITKILFAYLLWGIIFQERNVVSQFTFHGMLSYYLVSSFLSQLELSKGISEEIHERIRNGTFSKYMIVPINTELYFIFMEIGIVGFYFIFNLLVVIGWKFLFEIHFTYTHDPLIVVCAIIMVILGLLFMVQLNNLLGLLTLKYEGIGTFLMIKNNLMELITGSIIPLALFPESIILIMKIFPFYYITYLPAMLLTGQCEQEALCGIVVLMIWCIAIQFVIRNIWNSYIRKYDGVGI